MKARYKYDDRVRLKADKNDYGTFIVKEPKEENGKFTGKYLCIVWTGAKWEEHEFGEEELKLPWEK
jgi:hypothetical protein